MPAKRRVSKLRDQRITPEAVAAYIAGDEVALHRLLGLKPWEPSPIGAVGESPWPRGSGGETSWPKACKLREELDRLARG